MKKYKQHTLKEYLNVLSAKTATPGGGSATALTAATGAALIAMSARYSLGKSASPAVERQIRSVRDKSERICQQLLDCVDKDAQAYRKVVAARKKSARIRKAAFKQAAAVPAQVCRLCYQAVDLTPLLVQKGNKNLIGDIGVAIELLYAAFLSAQIMQAVNQ